ncbi:MAG: LTA synthase family protein [Bacilli bacterium]|nr:LTA synthase family protein [Bacilli bacterium]
MLNLINKIKNNYKSYLGTNILFLTFVISSLINSTLLRLTTVANYFDISPIIADFGVSVLIGSFGYLFKPKNQFKYFLLWTILFTLICIINSMYYTNYISYASISLLATSLQIVDVADSVTDSVMELTDFIYLWQIVVFIFVNIYLSKRNYYEMVSKIEVGKLRAKNTFLVGLVFISIFIMTLTVTDLGRLGKQWNREFIVMRFGIYVYQFNDIISSLEPQIIPLFGYDSNYKEFRDYYDNLDNEVETNEYTGTLEGKNVIFIHAESIQDFTLHTSFNGEEVTPNLNKLASEGLYFSNFYAEESVGTSSDTEFTLSTSLLPTSNGTVFINYWNREYVTIQKLLKEKGYYTFSMHGNNGTFWNRNVVHEAFGYDNFFYYTKDYTIDETIGLGLSDKSFFRQSVPIIQDIAENHEQYMATLIMLTNHMPFTGVVETGATDYDVDYKYTSVNEKTGKIETISAPFLEGTKLGNYIKSVHYADEAIGQLMEDLDEAGLLDNTVIVIYGDHDAKIKSSEYEYYYNYDPYTDSVLDEDDPNYQDVDYYDYELNRKVPLIIWTKDGLLQGEVDEVMGMIDVLPTLGNMLGISSDYALGHDIFSVEENVVVFPDGNWLTNKMYYNSQKQEGKLLNNDETVSIEYIEKYSQYAEKIVSVSNSIIIYDLIAKSEEDDALLTSK